MKNILTLVIFTITLLALQAANHQLMACLVDEGPAILLFCAQCGGPLPSREQMPAGSTAAETQLGENCERSAPCSKCGHLGTMGCACSKRTTWRHRVQHDTVQHNWCGPVFQGDAAITGTGTC